MVEEGRIGRETVTHSSGDEDDKGAVGSVTKG